MSFEEIFQKLEIIERKLDVFEDLKPILYNSTENMCKNCVCKEFAKKQSKNSHENEIEKDQEPEKEVSVINEPDTSGSDCASSLENDSFMSAFSVNKFGEDSTFDVSEIYNTFYAFLLDPENDEETRIDPNELRKDLEDLTTKLSNYKDSRNSLLQVSQALYEKLYFDKVRNSRRNLSKHVSSFNEKLDTSMLGICASSAVDIPQNVPTFEEDLASSQKFNDAFDDVVDATSVKKFKFQDSEEDFFNNLNASDTINSDDSDNNNDITIIADADEPNNN